MSKETKHNMEASASSLSRKCPHCLFIHHHHHCHRRHHVHHHHRDHHMHHHHHHHDHRVLHHCRPLLFLQHSIHDPESLPDAPPGMKLDQGHGFLFPPGEEEKEEKDEDEDEEHVFVMTDEWKEFFAKSEAKRRSERKKAKNKGRNTEQV